jgi:1-deoxy-D-xylulose-5-phosphate reductoisomerase
VALANKESIVMAGELLTQEAKRRKVDILPIDSEHCAIFQLLANRKPSEVKKIILTASGGPLLRLSERNRRSVSVETALAHPTWKMGPKISIDSATLMNKGFEMIEARWLFDLSEDQIDVVIHPQSIVHSLVEFSDRSIMAQMGLPDMRIPIAYSLFYPEREPLPFRSTDLTKLSPLTFESPRKNAFPLLAVARDALKAGGTVPAVLNGANEAAVTAFLAKRIPFLGIHKTIRHVINIHKPFSIKTVEDVLMADRWAKLETEKYLQKITS